MELLCPECMAPLESADGQTARCATHGGEYKILFTRTLFPSATAAMAEEDAPPVIVLPTSGGVCVQHPWSVAQYACANCHAGMCEACEFPQPDGSHLCPTCARQQAVAVSQAPPLITEDAPPLIGTAPPMIESPIRRQLDIPLPQGVRCVQHSNVQATAKCKACGGFMCQTCTFDLPGGVRVCPTCATATPKLSPQRRRILIASYIVAVWCTIMLCALFGGAFRELARGPSAGAVGVFMLLAIRLPALIGLALAVSTMERRQPKTIAMWIATVWNGLILIAFMLLLIVGMLSGGTR